MRPLLVCVVICFTTWHVSAMAQSQLRRSSKALTTLIEQLKPPHTLTARAQAAESLAVYGRSAVEPVRGLLGSDDSRTRYSACLALTRLGPFAEDAVPDLIAIAADHNDPLQNTAVFALGRVGPASSAATPLLCQLLSANGEELQRRAVGSLAAIGRSAVPTLVESLQSSDTSVCQRVCGVLQRIGTDAKDAVPALVTLTFDPDEKLRDAAFLALAGIGSPAVGDLVCMLRHEHGDVRRGAAMALSRMGAEAVPAISALCTATSDQDANTRFWAVRALGEVGNSGRGVTDCLIRASRDPDADVRWQTVVALQKLGVGKSTEQALVHLFDDAHPAVRAKARKIGLPADANRDNT